MLRYSKQVTEYFDNTPYLQSPGPAPELRCGEAGSKAQGAHVAFFLEARGDTISTLTFQAYGCPELIAACCETCSRLTGQSLTAAAALEPAELMRGLQIPAEKAGKILILQDALLDCCCAA